MKINKKAVQKFYTAFFSAVLYNRSCGIYIFLIKLNRRRLETFMKANHLRTRKMLIYGELQKYRILAESLLVGLVVGLVIVLHRLILSNVFSLFKNFYSMGRENFIYD